MRQRQIGVIPGIMGRLGDLGAIDKKYDVAISTVFGGALDILVTDTTDTATQCIMYLKQVWPFIMETVKGSCFNSRIRG